MRRGPGSTSDRMGEMVFLTVIEEFRMHLKSTELQRTGRVCLLFWSPLRSAPQGPRPRCGCSKQVWGGPGGFVVAVGERMCDTTGWAHSCRGTERWSPGFRNAYIGSHLEDPRGSQPCCGSIARLPWFTWPPRFSPVLSAHIFWLVSLCWRLPRKSAVSSHRCGTSWDIALEMQPAHCVGLGSFPDLSDV